MDWLFYISGWYFGWALVNGFIQDRLFWMKNFMWTIMWVWICWRFI